VLGVARILGERGLALVVRPVVVHAILLLELASISSRRRMSSPKDRARRACTHQTRILDETQIRDCDLAIERDAPECLSESFSTFPTALRQTLCCMLADSAAVIDGLPACTTTPFEPLTVGAISWKISDQCEQMLAVSAHGHLEIHRFELLGQRFGGLAHRVQPVARCWIKSSLLANKDEARRACAPSTATSRT